jgi:putative acetyltransferase
MVILIGGASCTGKTLLAQKLLEKYHFPYLSIDHLKMGIYRSGVNGSADCGFTPTSKDEIITEKLWPIIKGIIITNIENNQNIIIEGCYFPKSIHELDEKYLSAISFFHIVFSEEYIRKNFAEKIIAHRNVIEKRIHVFDESNSSLEKYILQHKKIKENCMRNGIQFFEIKKNYEEEIKSIYKWLEENIK